MELFLIILVLLAVVGNVMCVVKAISCFQLKENTTGFVYLACLFVGLGCIMGFVKLK